MDLVRKNDEKKLVKSGQISVKLLSVAYQKGFILVEIQRDWLESYDMSSPCLHVIWYQGRSLRCSWSEPKNRHHLTDAFNEKHFKSPHWHFKPFSYTQTDSLLTTGVRTRFTIDKILIILFKSTAVTIRLLAKWFWKWFWSTHFYLSSFLNPSMVTSVLDRSHGKKFDSKDQN